MKRNTALVWLALFASLFLGNHVWDYPPLPPAGNWILVDLAFVLVLWAIFAQMAVALWGEPK